jgi:FixJ family two-component response regulator
MIAVVDDDESMGKALSRLLESSSYRVRVYASAEALLADPDHGQANFLVLDIQLGGMSGLELRDRLAQTGRVPFIAFVTAHDEPATRERAWKGGCVAFLRKPFPGQRLLDAIHSAFAGLENNVSECNH